MIVDFEFDTREETEEDEEVGGSEVSVWDDGVMGVVPHSHKDGLYDVMRTMKNVRHYYSNYFLIGTYLASAIIDFRSGF